MIAQYKQRNNELSNECEQLRNEIFNLRENVRKLQQEQLIKLLRDNMMLQKKTDMRWH